MVTLTTKERGHNMPLQMNRDAFITCAVTGSGDTTGKSDKVPITPAEIANAAIDAAKAGAAIVHCHVHNPETGAPSLFCPFTGPHIDKAKKTGTMRKKILTGRMENDLIRKIKLKNFV